MADDESSDLSSLSSLSPAPSEDEGDVQLKSDKKGILKFFHKAPKGKAAKQSAAQKEASPPAPKRPQSPPHDYVLADNPDIAFIVMFRSRFSDALPKSLANFGPQELEREVTETAPGTRVENFLCAVLGLLLNRKQDVKPGHYNRALEDAISTHRSQWARDWEAKNPLSGGKTFAAMNPTERLTLLRTLIIWTLSSSEVVKGIITQSYKQNRHDDDLNQPLSVQPWGTDSDRRRYYLIEGQDDTAFRVYRESNPAGLKRTWMSVAGSIEELNALVDKLLTVDGGQKAKVLAQRMLAAVPRFEATEEKRRRREYRLMQKERFKRPEPGFSTYEGRTRGKRMKYTFSDDEDFMTDSSNRRSARNTGASTPIEPAGPVKTASGRQIKAPSRMTVDSSNNIVTTHTEGEQATAEPVLDTDEPSIGPTGRPRRSAAASHGSNGWGAAKEQRKVKHTAAGDTDSDELSEPDLGDDEEEDHVPNESEEEDDFDEVEPMDDEDIEEASPNNKTVTVKLAKKNNTQENGSTGHANESGSDQIMAEATNGAARKAGTKGQGQEKETGSPTADDKKRTTPAPEPATMPEQAQSPAQPKSLAFRGSPEKPAHAVPAKASD